MNREGNVHENNTAGATSSPLSQHESSPASSSRRQERQLQQHQQQEQQQQQHEDLLLTSLKRYQQQRLHENTSNIRRRKRRGNNSSSSSSSGNHTKKQSKNLSKRKREEHRPSLEKKRMFTTKTSERQQEEDEEEEDYASTSIIPNPKLLDDTNNNDNSKEDDDEDPATFQWDHVDLQQKQHATTKRKNTKKTQQQQPTQAEEPQDQDPPPPQRKMNWKKPADMPKRPLSAYNLFFRRKRLELLGDYQLHENSLLYEEAKRQHRKTHGMMSFERMAKEIAHRWSTIDEATKATYEQEAAIEKETYKIALEKYRNNNNNNNSYAQSGLAPITTQFNREQPSPKPTPPPPPPPPQQQQQKLIETIQRLQTNDDKGFDLTEYLNSKQQQHQQQLLMAMIGGAADRIMGDDSSATSRRFKRVSLDNSITSLLSSTVPTNTQPHNRGEQQQNIMDPMPRLTRNDDNAVGVINSKRNSFIGLCGINLVETKAADDKSLNTSIDQSLDDMRKTNTLRNRLHEELVLSNLSASYRGSSLSDYVPNFNNRATNSVDTLLKRQQQSDADYLKLLEEKYMNLVRQALLVRNEIDRHKTHMRANEMNLSLPTTTFDTNGNMSGGTSQPHAMNESLWLDNNHNIGILQQQSHVDRYERLDLQMLLRPNHVDNSMDQNHLEQRRRLENLLQSLGLSCEGSGNNAPAP